MLLRVRPVFAVGERREEQVLRQVAVLPQAKKLRDEAVARETP
jgi:hypothetical protein